METGMPWIDCTLTRGPIRGKSRNTIGLILRVQARQEIEDFMRHLANGATMPIDQVPGDTWTGVGENSKLEIYDVGNGVRDTNKYSLGAANSGLLLRNPQEARVRGGNADYDVVNLSFLTLKGLTEGVTIGISGAYSTEYITKFRSLLPIAVKRFLTDYLVPVTINLQIISRG